MKWLKMMREKENETSTRKYKKENWTMTISSVSIGILTKKVETAETILRRKYKINIHKTHKGEKRMAKVEKFLFRAKKGKKR